MGIFRKTLQRHGASCRVPNQALQLVPSMGWHLSVGVQRKPVDTGTAGACECPGTQDSGRAAGGDPDSPRQAEPTQG
jgi:hypothetical protein